jgi:hypothetical protein
LRFGLVFFRYLAELPMNLSSLVVLAALSASPTDEKVAATPGPPPGYYPPAPIYVYEPPCWDCIARHRRQIECYPTFHAIYYRRPYNYRNMIDYPWHADQHRGGWDGPYPPVVPMPALGTPAHASGSAVESPEMMPSAPTTDERELRAAALKTRSRANKRSSQN